MAEIVNEFQFPPLGRRHPWDSWCDGRTWRALLHVDFENARSFRAMLARKAKAVGKKVRTSMDAETGAIVFRFE